MNLNYQEEFEPENNLDLKAQDSEQLAPSEPGSVTYSHLDPGPCFIDSRPFGFFNSRMLGDSRFSFSKADQDSRPWGPLFS